MKHLSFKLRLFLFITKMTVKTLKDEKVRRDELCKKHFNDEEYQYPFETDFYKKYKVISRYTAANPYKKNNCFKFDKEKIEKNKTKLYFVDIRNKNQCDQIKGDWAPNALNRENFVDKGVCFVRANDSRCSTYENKTLLQSKNEVYRKSKGLVLDGDIHQTSLQCNKDKLCEWDDNLYQCFSTEYKDSHQSIPKLPSTWPKNIKQINIQNYLQQYYLNLLDERPQSYTPLFGVGNRCEGYQKMKISQPQTVINMLFKGFVKAQEENGGKIQNKGILVWHSTGSGKTCTAAGIMEAFWDTDKTIVFVSSIEALASNPPETFMKCAAELYPRFRKNVTPEGEPQTVENMFEKRKVKFFTFAQLAHYLLIFHPLQVKPEQVIKHRELLKNAILIIDEVHNIFRPLPNQKGEHFAVRDFLLDVKNPLISHLNIAVLTATPGDTMEEIVNLLNLVRDRDSREITVPQRPTDLENFGKSIKGLVSYFNMSADLSKYPKIERLEPFSIPMSMTQYKKYAEVISKTTNENKNWDKLVEINKSDNYYKQARKYSNALFNFDDLTLKDFSCKIPVLLNQIKKYESEKHYVYSAFYENRSFGQGILAIQKILNQEGYQQIDHQTAQLINEGKKPMLSVKKRYMLAITNDLAQNATRQHNAGANLQELMKLFNKPENKNGEYIQIFLATQKFNEGVDFKDLRNIHIFEPFLLYNKELQTIGRGARYCSHKNLNIKTGQWVVRIHKYLADYPIEIEEGNSVITEREIKKINISLQESTIKLETVKGRRGDEAKNIRENEKLIIKTLKKQLVDLTKQTKENNTLKKENIIMIDQKLEHDLKERITGEVTLLAVMKSYAIDCHLFREFHAQSGEIYNCLS